MYFRYFMWNFAGRDGDDKEVWLAFSLGKPTMRMFPTKSAPINREVISTFLPLILGIIGLLFQANRDVKNFWVNMLLFFIMGLGLVIYLNSPPVEPRERDYIYVGSFYAFAIWIGLGVLAALEFPQTIYAKNSCSRFGNRDFTFRPVP